MLWDISVSGLSSNLISNVLKNPDWLTGFVYLGTISVALCLYFISQPMLAKAQLVSRTDKTKGTVFKIGIIVFCGICVCLIPLQYHGILREIFA